MPAGSIRLLALLVAMLAPGGVDARMLRLRSPSGHAAVVVFVPTQGAVRWAIEWRGRRVLDAAPIALHVVGRHDDRWRVTAVARRSHDGVVSSLIGKASRARDRYREMVVTLGDGTQPRDLVVRAYDDGVAYRWRIRSSTPIEIADEDAGFGTTAATSVWAMPVKDFQSSYEEYYRHGPIASAAPADALIALPLLVHRGRAWAGITEAALHDWAGLYLVRHPGSAQLASHLSPRLDRAGVAVLLNAGEHVSPWRVAMLGDGPGRLIESNLVMLLNPPPDERDWSWVATGKTSFPWWNDYVWPGQGFAPGLNTATMDAYVDFDADRGIPFHTLDGYRGRAWYGGPIEPDGTVQDLTHAAPGIDMPELLAHARRRGVRIRLWCHWKPLAAQIDRAFDQWERWGIAGVMVDFMNRDDQQMVAFYDEIARKAADHHLTVVYHGAYKPTGEGRTWPNVLTREAVRGTEYDKFADNPGSTPAHEATTPFVRMLAGPMDIHEGGFDNVLPAAFRNRETAPMVMGTRAHTLATYIVEDNGLPMVADTPANYTDRAELAFLAAVPESWDETRVLAASVGHYLVIARRKGARWWLGAITDDEARTLVVRLPLKGGGRYRLTGYTDGVLPVRADRQQLTVSRARPLTLHLSRSGGFAAEIAPQY